MMSGYLKRAMVSGLAATAVLLTGCSKDSKITDHFESGASVQRTGEPPKFPDITKKYNERVAKLSSLWARADIRLEYVDDNAERKRDEAEATLQFELPGRFSFMISKLSDHYFTLGCDAEKYWWIDRKDSPPSVVFGRHDAATREKAALLGVPLLPREMIECLGVTLLAADQAPATSWSALKHWVVFTLPAKNPGAGTIEYWVDPLTADPARIRMFDASRNVTIDCHLQDIALVKVGARLDDATRMASKLKVFVPLRETILTISLNSMEVRSLKGSKAFDLAALKQAYRIDREIDVDKVEAEKKPAPAGASR